MCEKSSRTRSREPRNFSFSIIEISIFSTSRDLDYREREYFSFINLDENSRFSHNLTANLIKHCDPSSFGYVHTRSKNYIPRFSKGINLKLQIGSARNVGKIKAKLGSKVVESQAFVCRFKDDQFRLQMKTLKFGV